MIKVTEMLFHIEIIKIIIRINIIQEVSCKSRKEKIKKIRFIHSNIIINIFRIQTGFLKHKKYQISNFRTLMHIKIRSHVIARIHRSLKQIQEKIVKIMKFKYKNAKIRFVNN